MWSYSTINVCVIRFCGLFALNMQRISYGISNCVVGFWVRKVVVAWDIVCWWFEDSTCRTSILRVQAAHPTPPSHSQIVTRGDSCQNEVTHVAHLKCFSTRLRPQAAKHKLSCRARISLNLLRHAARVYWQHTVAPCLSLATAQNPSKWWDACWGYHPSFQESMFRL